MTMILLGTIVLFSLFELHEGTQFNRVFSFSASHVNWRVSYNIRSWMAANAQVEQLLSNTLPGRQQPVIGRIWSALVTARTMECFAHSLHKCRPCDRGDTMLNDITATCCDKLALLEASAYSQLIRFRPAFLAELGRDNGVSIEPAPDDKFKWLHLIGSYVDAITDAAIVF